MNTDTTNPFGGTCRALSTRQGYSLDLMSLSLVQETAGDLQVGLSWGPGRPDITLALRGIDHLNLIREPGTSAPILGQINAIPLMPFDVPWPPGLGIDTARSADLPPLLWLQCPGPLRLDTVSAIATPVKAPATDLTPFPASEKGAQAPSAAPRPGRGRPRPGSCMAARNGFAVSERGRIPATIVVAYRAGTPEAPPAPPAPAIADPFSPSGPFAPASS